jgi:citrate synthase
MSKPRQSVTKICGYDKNSISVRNEDLVNQLMGKLSFTEMLVFQLLGKKPTQQQISLVDAVLVTIMEHGLVPSAITTRLTHYGAPESFQGAVVAGLLGVGDRYAGTATECGEILERIVNAPESERQAVALQEVRDYRQQRRPLPGFGHPVHQDRDPRVPRLLEIAHEAGVKGEFISAITLLESSLHEELKKNLVTNISAAIAAVLAEAGIPAKAMRGIVLTARCAGLVGHLFEEMNHPVAHSMWEGAQEKVKYES